MALQAGQNNVIIFDSEYYLQQNPDILAAGIDALTHFNQFGVFEGRDPNQFFDTSYYLGQNPDLAIDGFNVFDHFINDGLSEQRAPSALFDPEYYLEQNPDLVAAGVNPIEHFGAFGVFETRNFTPLFDVEYYQTQNPDVVAAGVAPVQHFLENGISEGRNFTPLFDASFYERENPDVAAAGLNAVEHFLENGLQENRAPSQFFDTTYYLEQNADVAAAGVSAFEHFLNFGFKEDRDPSAFFDTSFYREQNTDVAGAGINPLEHFVEFGIEELRDPNANFDMQQVSDNNTAFAEAIANGQEDVFEQIIKDASEFVSNGGNFEGALSVAQNSSGDAGTPPPTPDSSGADTSSGGSSTPVGGAGGGSSAPPINYSNLAMTEVGGTLTISGTSGGASAIVVDVRSGSAVDNGRDINLTTGLYTNVTTVDASGITDVALNLTDVRTGIATTVTATALGDTLVGGSAGDTFTPGVGADVLTGNGGADTFINDGTTGNIDIITDFAGTTDVLSSALDASAFTFVPSTFRLVDNATSSDGWQFSSAAGADNSTALHQQDFDVTNAGAGAGKFMSETDDSGGLTGSADGDLLVLGGTTSGKTVSAGAGNDRIIDTTSNANVLDGEGGNDTISGSDGDDTFTGGANDDTFVSTFSANTADDGLDIITDFGTGDDTLDIELAAGSLTYLSGTNALVSAAETGQGFRFAASNGADNSTGLDDVNFDETNAGAGGGKIMSMTDDSAGLTGSGNSDFLYVAGTTSGKTISGAGGADRIIDDTSNGNTLNGGGGADTISGGAGDDNIDGGGGSDHLTGGEGADTVSVDDGSDTIIFTETTKVLDTLSFVNGGLSGPVTVTDFDIGGTGTDDAIAFKESDMIAGNAGAKNVLGSGSSVGQFDVDTANFMGFILITDNAAADFSDAHTVAAAAVSNLAADDAFGFVIDNGTDARVYGWADAVADGGDGDGVLDAAEFEPLAILTGIADVSGMDAGNFALA